MQNMCLIENNSCRLWTLLTKFNQVYLGLVGIYLSVLDTLQEFHCSALKKYVV